MSKLSFTKINSYINNRIEELNSQQARKMIEVKPEDKEKVRQRLIGR